MNRGHTSIYGGVGLILGIILLFGFARLISSIQGLSTLLESFGDGVPAMVAVGILSLSLSFFIVYSLVRPILPETIVFSVPNSNSMLLDHPNTIGVGSFVSSIVVFMEGHLMLSEYPNQTREEFIKLSKINIGSFLIEDIDKSYESKWLSADE